MSEIPLMWYGQCPNCKEPGKDALYYRKLDERNFWIIYKVCKKCGISYDYRIEPDVGTDFWREEQNKTQTLLGTIMGWREELKQTLKTERYEKLGFWRSR